MSEERPEYAPEEPEEGDDWEPHAKAHMNRAQFWPEVWFVSDHGNWSLLRMEESE